MHKSRIAVLVAVATLSIAGIADATLSRVGDQAAKAHFHASGPAGMAIDGNTDELQVADDGTTVTITVPLAKLDTGVRLRNEHMRDKYLEVGKYPNAVLKVPRASLKFPAEGATSTGDAAGTMSIHGKDKSVTFHYSATKNGTIKVSGSANINIGDYGITVPSYLGVTVKPDMSVDVAFVANDA